MKMSDGVDHENENQAYSTSGESTSVVGNLEFLRREYRGTDLVDDAQDQSAASISMRPNDHQENSWLIVEGSSPDHFGLATADDADDWVGKVFFNDITWMSHVELGHGILPCKGQYGQLSHDAEKRNFETFNNMSIVLLVVVFASFARCAVDSMWHIFFICIRR